MRRITGAIAMLGMVLATDFEVGHALTGPPQTAELTEPEKATIASLSLSALPPRDCAGLKSAIAEGPELRRAFKTPSLRGAVSRSPYMHSG